MSNANNTLARSMHDLGLAVWFGGSLMGAVGLNAAASAANDPEERPALAAAGWMRWAPVSAAAIGVHLIGGLGLIRGNRRRLGVQSSARTNTIIKSALTAGALGATAYSGVLGSAVYGSATSSTATPAAGATEPSEDTPELTATAQRRLAALQWALPALTGALVVLGARQGEQQRPRNVLAALVPGRS